MGGGSLEKPQRVVFGETLVELGAANGRIVVLDADVSSSTQTRQFAEAFPDRFFNVGIAEANMVSIAAGLAACGYVPVVSTFALFIALRAGEQVRSQAAYTALNVKLVGGYAGLSDFADGASHQSVEDLAVMRAIPAMTVIAPGDAVQMRLALAAAIDHEGPVFLRVSREAVGEIHDGAAHPFRIGKGITLRAGSDVTLVVTGTMLPLALAAADALGREGVSAGVIDMHTLKPLDGDLLVEAARATGALVTIEEHSILGGLGGAVCELLAERRPAPVIRCGIPDRFGQSGPYAAILARSGLDVGSVCRAARRAMAMKAK
ncbi:MAG: transketolase family protein [Planctomycetes bacterium]|nr:transketolase family protein [Planctomycetota bacterium]